MNQKTRQLVLTALFVAIIVLLYHVGSINLPIKVTITAIPVIVGTLILGLKTGVFLGFCFGGLSTLSAFGLFGLKSLYAGNLAAASPVLAIIMSIVPRLMIPIVAYETYKLMDGKKLKATLPITAAAGSLCNTVLYLGMMLLFYILVGLSNTALLEWIGGTALIAGGCEALVAAIVAPPIVIAIRKIYK